ncbi:aspartyl/glutamyl-tRNA amidotransferase subunit B [Gloeomargarita lithophora Alchichica-D10]|uniref:Aspartyl/glutamyl-tRNA(Asn/Gln) amidotransferase subunit B n=1 Tax=Gloeomargarita lithophora Alchichica-D10 TaxID=1188229 RepID=A0A1J0ABY6_9CYAN|nr:Asp-tRNA(Asn)/Glu-tRNA(Gln) amidotransferase subunit GatB [Gloeomargarita lithophora]APB33440.1 aspartyl/glutamyl-tRNA amidotransferase subunit B [Gloeomargarita lithophora Alchichica-D10]
MRLACALGIKNRMTATIATRYETVIGLEIHCQLGTATKIFCGCSTAFGAPPNTQVCPVCLGHPGVLPVLNEQVLAAAVQTGLALNCTIAPYSKFDRKQYFYPDLPKNYQISQYDLPIASDGWVEIELADDQGNFYRKRVTIQRLHMEEDAGKLVHAGAQRLSGSDYSLVDFNRAGVPLCEIVSGPDLRSGAEAAEYAQELRRIVRYLGVCDGNMQEGSLRCDVNISVRPVGETRFGTKVEIKNMNSFNAIQRAIDYETKRQITALESGEPLVQETRLWDEASQRTVSMRVKEGASDYRYFPEPDLPPLHLTPHQIDHWRTQLPELPRAKRQRYQSDLGLSAYDSRVLTDERAMAEYFEATVTCGADPKLASNWISGDLTAWLKTQKQEITDLKCPPAQLAELIGLIQTGTISGKIAKELLPELLTNGGSPRSLVAARGLTQVSDPAILGAQIDQVLANHPQELSQYRGGKTKLFGFFVGKVMQQTGGRADPQRTNELLKQKLAP